MAEVPYYDSRADWSLIPHHMRGAVERYVMHGIPPGSFLTALINNDLREAVARADDMNVNRLPDYVRFFYNSAPSGSWGHPDAVSQWTRRGGLSERTQ